MKTSDVYGTARTMRRAAAFLAVAACFALLFCVLFTAAEADHDCVGDGCRVCALLSLCRNVLRAAVSAAVLTGCALAAVRGCRPAAARAGDALCRRDPVALRVKLSN